MPEFNAVGAVTTSGGTIKVNAGKFNYDSTLTISGGKVQYVSGTWDDSTSDVAVSSGTLDIDANVSIDGKIKLSGTGTLDVASNVTLTCDDNLEYGAGTITNNGTISMSDGKTLDINAAITMTTGTIDLKNNSILDIAANTSINKLTFSGTNATLTLNDKTLTQTGDAIEFGASKTISISSGTITNTNAIKLDTSTLKLTGNLTLSNNGGLDINGDCTINLQTNNLVYQDSGNLDIDGNTLTLEGTGRFQNTGNLRFNNANSKLTISNASTIDKITTGANVNSGKGLDIDDSCTITSLTVTNDLPVDIASGKTVNSGSGAKDISLDSSGDLQFESSGGGGTWGGSNDTIDLNGGTLSVSKTMTIASKFTVNGDSTIGIANGVTLTANNSTDVNIGANTLTIESAGTGTQGGKITPSFDIKFDNASSILKLADQGTNFDGTVTTVSGTNVSDNKGLDIDGSVTIKELTVNATLPIDIANTLVQGGSGAAAAPTITTTNLDSNGTLKFTGTGDLNAKASGAFKLDGGTLDVDASFKLGAVITHTDSSTIDVASGKTLTLNDNTSNQNIDIGAFTLTLKGGGNIDVSADVRINNASSIIEMETANTFLNCEVKTSTDVTSSGSGRVGTANVFGLLLKDNIRIATLTVTKKLAIDITSGKTARIDSIVIGDGTAANTASVLKFVSGGNGGRLNNKATNRGTLNLKKGSLDVDVDTSIGAVVSVNGDSVIDVASGKTLTLDDNTSNQNIDVGANTLTIKGTGEVDVSADVRINNASSIIEIDGADTFLNCEVTTSTDVTSSGAGRVGTTNVFGLLLKDDVRIATLTVTKKLAIDITTGKTARIDSIVIGDGSAANTASVLKFVSGGNGGRLNDKTTNRGTLNLKKGSLDVDLDTSIGAVVSINGDSIIDVASGKTLTLDDDTSNQNIDVGGNTLNIKGTGEVDVAADIRINNASSIIQMDGDETFLNAEIKTSTDVTSSGAGRVGTTNVFGLLLTNNVRIATLTVTKKLAIDITTGKTARIDSIVIGDGSAANTASVLKFVSGGNGGRLNNKTTNRGTLNLKKGSLDVDVDTSIGAVVSINGDSIIDVATGKTLTLDDDTSNQNIDVGGNTLNIKGAGEVDVAADVRINNASSIIQMDDASTFLNCEVTTSADVTSSGAGRVGTANVFGLLLTNDVRIATLTVTKSLAIDITTGKTARIDSIVIGDGSAANTASVLKFVSGGNGGRLNDKTTNRGTLNLKKGSLDVDKDTSIGAVVSVNGDSIIDVANGETLTR